MSQSRRHSVIESLTNIAAGIVLQFFVMHYLSILLGFPFSWSQNLAVTAVMTVISLLRSYGLRRLFNRWHQPPVVYLERHGKGFIVRTKGDVRIEAVDIAPVAACSIHVPGPLLHPEDTQ